MSIAEKQVSKSQTGQPGDKSKKQSHKKRLDRKREQIERPGSRVIVPLHADTHRVLNLIQRVDIGRKILTENMSSKPGFAPDDVVPLIDAWNAALVDLHKAGKTICEKTEVFFEPKGWSPEEFIAMSGGKSKSKKG